MLFRLNHHHPCYFLFPKVESCACGGFEKKPGCVCVFIVLFKQTPTQYYYIAYRMALSDSVHFNPVMVHHVSVHENYYQQFTLTGINYDNIACASL